MQETNSFLKEVTTTMDQSTHIVRRKMWQKIVLECQNRPSGMSAKQWLIDNDINEKSYYYWQRKLRTGFFENNSEVTELSTPASKEELSFVEITKPNKRIPSEELSSLVHPTAVIKAGSITIAITNDISDSLLSKIVREVSHA